MMRGDLTRWPLLSRGEVMEVVLFSWTMREQLDAAERRQQMGDPFALLSIPAEARPDEGSISRFKTFYKNQKPNGGESR